MDEMITDATPAESSPAPSSPAPESQTDPSQATTQPALPQQPKGFHEHPDWQRMVRSRHEDRALIGQLQQRLQNFEQAQRQSPSAPGQPPTPEEQQALVALERLIAMHPKLGKLMGMADKIPQYEQRFQGMDQMQAQAAQAHNHAARGTIKELAEKDGLPTDEKSMKHIVRLVAGEAMSLEDGDARYRSGDMSVLEEAFQNIKPWLQAMRKPAESTVLQTKNKLKQLPTPLKGSTPGQPAIPKPEPGKAREYEQSMFARARQMLMSGDSQ